MVPTAAGQGNLWKESAAEPPLWLRNERQELLLLLLTRVWRREGLGREEIPATSQSRRLRQAFVPLAAILLIASSPPGAPMRGFHGSSAWALGELTLWPPPPSPCISWLGQGATNGSGQERIKPFIPCRERAVP